MKIGVDMNENLMLALLVAAGGATGALLRFSVTMLMPPMEGIAWNTLFVNFMGSLLITLIFYGIDMDITTRMFLFTGVFGAFTTMSAISLETVELYATGAFGTAVMNFLLNVSLCIGGGFAGRFLALTFFPG